MSGTNNMNEPEDQTADEFVPEDVRDHPSIQAVWEGVGEGHPLQGVAISTGWEGTQATLDDGN